MTADQSNQGLSPQELEEESVTALPDKEVASVLDLNADLDLAIDAAAPIDLAVAANANVAAPIDAAAAANILSVGSDATAVGDQAASISQNIDADAVADATQDSTLDQSNDTVGSEPAPAETPTSTETTTGGVLDGDLLNVDVDLAADADIAAPINGAVAANANVAAPINASVAANIGSLDSEAVSVANQDAVIEQNITGEAAASSDQVSDIKQ